MIRRRAFFKSFLALLGCSGAGAALCLYWAGARFLFPILVFFALQALFLLFFPDLFLLKRRLRAGFRPVPPSDPLSQIQKEAAQAVFCANRKALPPDKGGRSESYKQKAAGLTLPPDKGGRGGFAAKAPAGATALFTVNSGAVFAIGFSRFTKNRIVLSRDLADSLTKEELKAVFIYFETVFASGFGLFWTLLAVFFRLMQAVFFLAETPFRLLFRFFQKLKRAGRGSATAAGGGGGFYENAYDGAASGGFLRDGSRRTTSRGRAPQRTGLKEACKTHLYYKGRPRSVAEAPDILFPLFLKATGRQSLRAFLSIDQQAFKNGAKALPRALWKVQALSKSRPLFFPETPAGQEGRRLKAAVFAAGPLAGPVGTASAARAFFYPASLAGGAVSAKKSGGGRRGTGRETAAARRSEAPGDLWPIEPPAPFLSPLFFGNPPIIIKSGGGRRFPSFQPELRGRVQALAKGRFPPPP